MTIVSSRGERFLRDVVLDTTGCLMTVDDSGVVVFTNGELEQFFGYDPEEVVGKHVSQLVGDEDSVMETIRQVAPTTESMQPSLVHSDGYEVPSTVSVDSTEHDDARYYTLTLRERRVREQQAHQLEETERFLRQVFEQSTEAIFVFDLDNDEIIDCNTRACELLGYEREDLLELGPSAIYRSGEQEFTAFTERVRETGSDRTEELVCETADGETLPVKTSGSLIEIENRVCVLTHARELDTDNRSTPTAAETRDRKPEHYLEALNDVTVELMRAETTDEIARIAIDTVENVLEYDLGCVRLYDTEENHLQPVAMTNDARELVDSRPAFDLEITCAGRAFRNDEMVVQGSDEGGRFDGTPIQASLHLPLGDHGTITIADTESGGFRDIEIENARMITANVTSALDRAERIRALRERETELRQQRDQLDTINQVNSFVHELIEVLIDGETRDGIEQQICARLTDSDQVQSAWIGALDATEETITAKASAGVDGEYLRAIDELPLSRLANGTVERALDTGAVAIDQRYLTTDTEARSEIGDPDDDVETTVSVPIRYGDRTFGVLVIATSRKDGFHSTETESFEVLGDSIGFALNAFQKRELLLSDEIVKLEFEVTDPDCLAVSLSDTLETYCRIDRTVLTSDGKYLNYVSVQDTSAEAALEAAEAVDSVIDCRVVSESENQCSLEVRRTECGSQTMMDFGATMQTAEAEDGTGRLVIEAPRSVNIRSVVEAYQEWNPHSELIAKHDVDRSVATANEFRETLESNLTEKQRAALEAAYAAGYYEWPRVSTAEEVADSMGIASATLHQHLRTAIRELLAEILGEEHVAIEG